MKKENNVKSPKISGASDAESAVKTTAKGFKKTEKKNKLIKSFMIGKTAEKIVNALRNAVDTAERKDSLKKGKLQNKHKELVPKLPTEVAQPNGLESDAMSKIEKKAAKKSRQKLKKKLRKESKFGAPANNESLKTEVFKRAITSKIKQGKSKTKPLEDLKECNQVNLKALEEATVFVGNLPINTKRVQLARLFKDFGPVKGIRFRTAGGKTIFSHKQRKEAGSLNAYVVLQDTQCANRAIALNGIEFKSNHLRITKSNSNNQGDENTNAKNTIFVGNLKYSATEESLREIFSSCGEVEYVRCLRDGDKGCKGIAYVCFTKPEAVGLALELNETLLDERPIHVQRYLIKKLGAKQARDTAKQSITKAGTDVKTRLKLRKNKLAEKKNRLKDTTLEKKKTTFRGVKIDSIKKEKIKKLSKQQIELVKKIAPKTK